MSTVLLSVGDASGDVYAADLVRELRELRPGTRFLGLGGGEMEKAGVELLVDRRALATSGLVELLPDLHRIVRAWWRMASALRVLRPDLVVLVDNSGFNLPLAARARRRSIPTLYYVSPQVWGWRSGRIKKMASRVDRLAVIFPFETEVYAGTGLPVEFVGHPLLPRLREAAVGREEARRRLGIAPDARLVAVLPGSRRTEIRHLLPLHLEAVRVLHARDPRLQFVLPRAPSVDATQLEEGIRRAGLPSRLGLEVVPGRAHEVLCAADVALAKPGTCTLEAAVLGCPLVVAARSSRLTAFVLRRLVKVDSLTIPNLIAGAPVVPEFLQEEALPERIADAVEGLMGGAVRTDQLEALARVRDRLTGDRSKRRAAAIAAEMLRARLGP